MVHEGRCRGGVDALWRRLETLLETLLERLVLGHELNDLEPMNIAKYRRLLTVIASKRYIGYSSCFITLNLS